MRRTPSNAPLPGLEVLTAAMTLTFLVACDPSLPDVSAVCRTNRDCAVGLVCHYDTGLCQPEPVDGLYGTFTCTVEDGTVTYTNTTDVLGSVGKVPLPLSRGVACSLDSTGGLRVYLRSLKDSTKTRVRAVIGPFYASELNAKGGVGKIGYQDVYVSRSTADGLEWPIARSVQGTITLRGGLSVGSIFDGAVDAQLVTVCGVNAGGITCPTGYECDEHYYVDTSNPGQCVRPSATGTCDYYTPCPITKACVNKVCVPRCTPGVGASCPSGSSCSTLSYKRPDSGACVATVARGAACNDTSAFCGWEDACWKGTCVESCRISHTCSAGRPCVKQSDDFTELCQ